MGGGGVIVIDNVVLHSGGSCNILVNFLWNAPGLDGLPLNNCAIHFPTQAPELNPIELNWNMLVLQMKKVNISIPNMGVGLEVFKHVTCDVILKFSHHNNKQTTPSVVILVVVNYIFCN